MLSWSKFVELGWTWPPLVGSGLVAVALLYAIGAFKMLRRGADPKLHRIPIICFSLGWISLLLALDSPIHELGEQLFWVHMTQHEILMLISAPLLVLGRPLVPFLWALPKRWREEIAQLGNSRPISTLWRSVSSPLNAWLLSAAALWIWHAPWLFDQTLHNHWIHAAQHSTFLFSALLFWWPLMNRSASLGYGGGVIYVFTTILHTSILGALLTFAQHPWYATYQSTAPSWHLSALEDQQLGGLIMWIPAGTLLLIVALVLFSKWLKHSQQRWQYTRMAGLASLSKGAAK